MHPKKTWVNSPNSSSLNIMDQSMNSSYGPITFLDVLTSSGRDAIRQHSIVSNCSETTVPQSLTVGETDFYVQHYVFPVQFILGVAGNSINLLVLLGTGMKNQVIFEKNKFTECSRRIFFCPQWHLPILLSSFVCYRFHWSHLK